MLLAADVAADCPLNRRYMNHCQRRRSPTNDLRSSRQAAVTADMFHRRPTTKLVSCCKCRRPRTCRWIDGAGMEYRLRPMMEEDVAEAEEDRAVVV